MGEPNDLFSKQPVPSWEPDGGKLIAFSIVSIREGYKARLGKKTRLYKNKQRIDNTGGDSRVWTISGEFYNGSDDSDAPSRYPDDIDALCDQLLVANTGWLTLPTRGRVRAQLETYERLEESAPRDFAALQMVFVEDDEDDQTAGSFKAVPAAAVASLYVIEWDTSISEDAGVMGDPFGEIEDLCNELNELAAAPELFVASWESRVSQVITSIASVERNYTQAAQSGTGELVALLSNPGASRGLRKGRKLADTLARSTASSVLYRIKRYSVEVSIYDVAIDVGQQADRLITLNSNIGDLLAIPAHTPVRYLLSP